MKTREEYVESLRKLNLKVYFMGERIHNPVDHPVIRPSLNSIAMTYELAEMEEYKDIMTATSNLTGKTVNRFCHLHQSPEDLKNKVKMQRLLGQKTASCFQRCHLFNDLRDGSSPRHGIPQTLCGIHEICTG